MKTLMRAATLALALGATGAPMALAQAPTPAADSVFHATTLNLAASGETKVAPDMATISLGVQVEAPTAAEAMQQNAARMNAVVAALRKGGIAAKDIQTSGLNLNAQYRYEENKPPVLTGYQASNLVTVTVHDLTRLGQAVDATVAAGANQIHGVSFGLDDRDAAENAAREAAVRDLKAKADLYARATGYRVARLVSLSEGTPSYGPRPPMPIMAMANQRMAKEDTSVSPGELTVRVDITGFYELAR
jgi:uncharacterized protein YggE